MELPVVGPTAPVVPVLRPVVDEKQDARRRQTLYQAVERGLGLGIDPVEILAHHQERLGLALPHEEPLHRLQRAEPPLGRVEDLPASVLHRDVEKGEERRQLRFEGEERAGDLLPHRAGLVAVAHLEVPLERINHWEVGRGLAVRNAAGL